MTLHLDPKTLAAIHSALKSIPDRKNQIPICGMYHLEAGDRLTITATDCDIEAALTVDCKADFAPVCLPPYLIEAAGGLGGSQVKIVIDERQAVATSGRARFAAPILPGKDFPIFRNQFEGRAEIAGKALASIISATVDAASVPGVDNRYYLEGVFLVVLEDGGERRLHAVATDGHRLHTTSVPAPAGMLLDGIIVPTKAAHEIARLAGKCGDNPLTLETSARAIAVTTPSERLASKLIDGTYPDWRRVVPPACGTTATLDIAELLAALDRVTKIQEVNEAGRKGKSKSSAIRIAEDGEYLLISTPSAPGNDAEALDSVRAEFSGSFGSHGVSAKLLRATLSAMKDRAAETVTIDTSGSGSPMRVESPTDEDFVGIVMPMRV